MSLAITSVHTNYTADGASRGDIETGTELRTDPQAEFSEHHTIQLRKDRVEHLYTHGELGQETSVQGYYARQNYSLRSQARSVTACLRREVPY